MRRKRELILPFAGNDDGLPKTVRDYRQKYKGISAALDSLPDVLDAVHQDLMNSIHSSPMSPLRHPQDGCLF